MKQKVKKLILKLRFLINRIPFNNKIRRRGTMVNLSDVLLLNCRIDCRGKGNSIKFHSGGVLTGCLLKIRGNNNIVEIGENTRIVDGEFWIEDDNNKIVVGSNTALCGKIHLACIEGCAISIGNDCLFSSDIVFRTGDSHSVLDLNGNRVNPSQNISINNHVWIGNKVIIEKGTHIAENSIIGTGAIVTKPCTEPNVALAGVPARVVKQNINWCSERI